MSEQSFDILKAALSSINNIITYNTTIEAIEHYISLLKGELKARVILYKENVNCSIFLTFLHCY